MSDAPARPPRARKPRRSRKAAAPQPAPDNAPVPPGAGAVDGSGYGEGAAAQDAAAAETATAPPAGPSAFARLRARLGAALRLAWRERRAPPLARRAGAVASAAWLSAWLAGLALALALGAGLAGERLARAWTAEFGAAATLTAIGSPQRRARDFDAALRALETTPGIAEARVMPLEERRALLTPWLGEAAAAAAEPPPMAEVTLEGEGPDLAMLALRLAEEAPGAVFDSHAGWRGPLLEAAMRARLIGWGAVGLAAAAGFLAAAATAAAWTASARGSQALLRRLGAPPARLRLAWPGRAAWRGFWAGTLGCLLVVAALAGPELAWGPDARLSLTPEGWQWATLAAAPFWTALAAWTGAALALRRGQDIS